MRSTLFNLKKIIKECISIGHQFHIENRVFSNNSILKKLLNNDVFSSTFFDSVTRAWDDFTKPFRFLIDAYRGILNIQVKNTCKFYT